MGNLTQVKGDNVINYRENTFYFLIAAPSGGHADLLISFPITVSGPVATASPVHSPAQHEIRDERVEGESERAFKRKTKTMLDN